MTAIPAAFLAFPRASGAVNWLRPNQTAVNGYIGAGVAYLPTMDFAEFSGKFFVYLGLDDSISTTCVPADRVLECPAEETN